MNTVEKLECFLINNKIPNILLYGNHETGKKTIILNFIRKIYNYDESMIKENVFIIDCNVNNGIDFIRDNLKSFSRLVVNTKKGVFFKSVVLLNGDKLTNDAQFALRRCLELSNHNTRYFLITHDKTSIIKPILSRFSIIYSPSSLLSLNSTNPINRVLEKEQKNLLSLTNELYQNSYSGLDIIEYVKENENIKNKNDKLMLFYLLKKEIRNEELLIFLFLQLLYEK